MLNQIIPKWKYKFFIDNRKRPLIQSFVQLKKYNENKLICKNFSETIKNSIPKKNIKIMNIKPAIFTPPKYLPQTSSTKKSLPVAIFSTVPVVS